MYYIQDNWTKPVQNCLLSIFYIFHLPFSLFLFFSFVLCLMSFVQLLVQLHIFPHLLHISISFCSFSVYTYIQLYHISLSFAMKTFSETEEDWGLLLLLMELKKMKLKTSAKKSFSAMKRREENIFHNVIITNKTKQHLAEEKK